MQRKNGSSKNEVQKKNGVSVKKPLLFLVSSKEKIFLAKHLAVMTQAGIPLHEALAALEEQAATPSLRYLFATCMRDLEGGQVLAYCLNKFPKVFDPFFANVIAVGETAGTLSQSLGYLATQLEKSQALKGKVRAALIYPVIVFVGALGIGTYLAFFLLPKLESLFRSLGDRLPPTTALLLSSTAFVRAFWPWLLTALGVGAITLILLWRIRAIRFSAHRVLVSLPIVGKLTKQIQTTQFARILGTLLTAGVKVIPALRITADSLGNLVYQKMLHEVADAVERGSTIADELKKRRHLFNQITVSMVRVGESTGRLADSLLALAAFTESEMDDAIRNLTALIEPIVLIVVGVLVGFVALSIISPIYKLTETVSR